ncbi:MAG: aspartate kinase [Chloroflexota bacterium]|nr:aspartate kinase [Chloroflexota bacterium]MDE2683438.1 aspartate kinase [Chloroflexota bacterium]
MGLFVHKYGGSSVADAGKIVSVARRIAGVHDAGHQVVTVVSAMGDTTDELIDLARTVTPEPDPRELDLLLSTGELVSITLLSMALRSLGYDAISLSGPQAGIRTDNAYGRARISEVDPARLQHELAKGRLVIVAGFQGLTPDEDITTLGRGGSDTTAVALAAALEADRCDIYTDVEGIYTADPRVVSKAAKLSEVAYDEMLELAAAGAKMHPRSIELGAVYKVPIYVASSFTDAPGTMIQQPSDEALMEDRIKVTGIAYQTNVAKVTVCGVEDKPGVAAALFEPLAASGISVDTIVQNTSADRTTTDISFTVTTDDLPQTLRRLSSMAPALSAAQVISDSSLASVSVVGSGMQNTPGYASRMFRILADGGINIDMITTSEIRISCIIGREQAHEAVRLLHRGFELDEG